MTVASSKEFDHLRCYACGKPVGNDEQRCPGCSAPLILKKQYRVQCVLGTGGFGVVYQATHITRGTLLAIKAITIVSPQHRAQVEAEATLLNHTAIKLGFIPHIWHKWTDNDRVYIVMDYVDGQTLEELAAPRWSPEEVARFLETLLGYLILLHDAGILHRDLKPANIKQTSQGDYVLLDFGIAQHGRVKAARAGSVDYAPLEQLQGLPTDARSDLYSLAATAYHLLTGTPPVGAIERQALGLDVLRPSTRIAAVPAALESTLLQMLVLDSAQRPADARAALALLKTTQPLPSLQASGSMSAVSSQANDSYLPHHSSSSSAAMSASEGPTRPLADATLPLTNNIPSSAGMPTRFLTVPLAPLVRQTPVSPTNDTNAGGTPLYGTNSRRGVVWSLAFSADGAKLAAGYSDHAIRIWQVAGGQLLHMLNGHTGQPRSIVFMPDGLSIISGAEDGTVREWPLADDRQHRVFEGNSAVRSLACSPDGTLVAAGHVDGRVRIWERERGTLLHELRGHYGEVRSLAFSPDGTRLVSGSYDTALCIWQVANGKQVHRLQRHQREVRCLAVSPDGTRLASGSYDNIVHVWDTMSGTLLQSRKGGTQEIRYVMFDATEKLLALETMDGIVKLWDMDTGSLRRTLTGNTREVRSVALSPDTTIIASGSYDNTIRLWER